MPTPSMALQGQDGLHVVLLRARKGNLILKVVAVQEVVTAV